MFFFIILAPGVVELEELPDMFVAHICPFINLLDEELQKFFQSDRHLTDEQTDMVQSAYILASVTGTNYGCLFTIKDLLHTSTVTASTSNNK